MDSRKKKILIVGILVISITTLGGCTLTGANFNVKPMATEAERSSATQSADIASNNDAKGYKAAAYSGSAFYAGGTGGRLDKFDNDDNLTNLQSGTQEDIISMYADKTVVLVGLRNGNLLQSSDGKKFRSITTGKSCAVNDIKLFRNKYYLAMDDGTILVSTDCSEWKSTEKLVNTPIIAVATSDSCIMAITAETDVLMSTDGSRWTCCNANDEYKQYHDAVVYKGLLNMGESFLVNGYYKNTPNIPYIAFSGDGKLWNQKSLNMINGVETSNDTSICVYKLGVNIDQLVGFCDGGRLLTITDCVKCNTMSKVTDNDMKALAFNGSKLLAVGDNFDHIMLGSSDYRQYNIAPEQAMNDVASGAALIDVRTKDEFATGYIRNAVNMPLDTVEQELASQVPSKDTEIIFYCKSGGRAKQALEKALSMGYSKVYNLGGIDNWPYELVTQDRQG